jgi:hypothetical protein
MQNHASVLSSLVTKIKFCYLMPFAKRDMAEVVDSTAGMADEVMARFFRAGDKERGGRIATELPRESVTYPVTNSDPRHRLARLIQ